MTRPCASLAGFIALALLACREPAFGQCVVFEDPTDMFRVADAVFIGSVRKTEPTGDVGFHIVMHRASFEIEGVWKGDVKQLEMIGTVEAFQPGKRYLVFAGASPEMSRFEEGRLRTSLECGWAEIEDDRSPKLRWLRESIGKPRPATERDRRMASGVQPTHSPYLGQPVPGLTPVLFAPGIVSTDAIELNGVFAPDMKEFFFTRLIDGTPTMFHSQLSGGAWSAPRPLMLYPGRAASLAVDMAVSSDGSELFFLGRYHAPSSAGAKRQDTDIWRSRRVNGAWATAEVVPSPVSTDADEVYPTIVKDGSLYFTSNRPGGLGRSSLYRAQRLADGTFAKPVLLPPPVNSEFGVGDPFVSPDESYMVFSSRRPPSVGAGDLFVAFRRADGGWSDPVNLGATVNTEHTDFCPFVTPDGKYFFFSRRHRSAGGTVTAGDVYWLEAKFLEQFRREGKQVVRRP